MFSEEIENSNFPQWIREDMIIKNSQMSSRKRRILELSSNENDCTNEPLPRRSARWRHIESDMLVNNIHHPPTIPAPDNPLRSRSVRNSSNRNNNNINNNINHIPMFAENMSTNLSQNHHHHHQQQQSQQQQYQNGILSSNEHTFSSFNNNSNSNHQTSSTTDLPASSNTFDSHNNSHRILNVVGSQNYNSNIAGDHNISAHQTTPATGAASAAASVAAAGAANRYPVSHLSSVIETAAEAAILATRLPQPPPPPSLSSTMNNNSGLAAQFNIFQSYIAGRQQQQHHHQPQPPHLQSSTSTIPHLSQTEISQWGAFYNYLFSISPYFAASYISNSVAAPHSTGTNHNNNNNNNINNSNHQHSDSLRMPPVTQSQNLDMFNQNTGFHLNMLSDRNEIHHPLNWPLPNYAAYLFSNNNNNSSIASSTGAGSTTISSDPSTVDQSLEYSYYQHYRQQQQQQQQQNPYNFSSVCPFHTLNTYAALYQQQQQQQQQNQQTIQPNNNTTNYSPSATNISTAQQPTQQTQAQLQPPQAQAPNTQSEHAANAYRTYYMPQDLHMIHPIYNSVITSHFPPIFSNIDTLFHLAAHLEQKKRGITREELDKLQTYRYKSTKSTVEDVPKCIVCLDDFEPKQNIRILFCKHEFHAKCIDKWLKINRTCPSCRSDAFNGSAQKEGA